MCEVRIEEREGHDSEKYQKIIEFVMENNTLLAGIPISGYREMVN